MNLWSSWEPLNKQYTKQPWILTDSPSYITTMQYHSKSVVILNIAVAVHDTQLWVQYCISFKEINIKLAYIDLYFKILYFKIVSTAVFSLSDELSFFLFSWKWAFAMPVNDVANTTSSNRGNSTSRISFKLGNMILTQKREIHIVKCLSAVTL